MFGKNKSHGFKAQKRTQEEIRKEYAETAIEVGHKSRIMLQHKIRFEQFEQETLKLQKEIDQLTQKLVDLNISGMATQTQEETKETA